uniref:Uncharacterized protein n=1 Tax=Anguilla anguilla TaxID=7936 RepID=A0A0E9UNX2_ANGAN
MSFVVLSLGVDVHWHYDITVIHTLTEQKFFFYYYSCK